MIKFEIGVPLARVKASATLGLLSAPLLVAISLFSAESADDIKLPVGYRNLFHVNTMVVDKASPLFEALGGMHNVYANARAVAVLQKGGPYPDGQPVHH
jgi:hypothetical protein